MIFRTALGKPFSDKLFHPVTDAKDFLTGKPLGGLWFSPVEENNLTSWQAFIENTGIRDDVHVYNAEFTDDFKMLTIDSLDDLMQALDIYGVSRELEDDYKLLLELDIALSKFLAPISEVNHGFEKKWFDYSKLAEDFDAINLTWQGLYAAKSITFGAEQDIQNFHFWDVPTLLVFKLDHIRCTPV